MKDIVSVLSRDEFKDVFQSFYILPSIFNTDLDRGFSVIDYSINEEMTFLFVSLVHIVYIRILMKILFPPILLISDLRRMIFSLIRALLRL